MTATQTPARITCLPCGSPLVPGLAEEAANWRTADGGRYFCSASDDALHHPTAAGNAPSLNEPGADATHFNFGQDESHPEATPICGYAEDADGYSTNWASVTCLNCIAAR